MDGTAEERETSTILNGLTNSIDGVETLFPAANVNDGFLNFLAIKDKSFLDTITVPDLLQRFDSSTQNIKYKRLKNCVIEQLDSAHSLTVNIGGDSGSEPAHIHQDFTSGIYIPFVENTNKVLLATPWERDMNLWYY